MMITLKQNPEKNSKNYKREKKYIEKHINFINFSLKEFSNVLHKDIIEALKKNEDDYGCTLSDLLEINLSF
jgi:hypothetical protein